MEPTYSNHPYSPDYDETPTKETKFYTEVVTDPFTNEIYYIERPVLI